jgi:hypothetical protein
MLVSRATLLYCTRSMKTEKQLWELRFTRTLLYLCIRSGADLIAGSRPQASLPFTEGRAIAQAVSAGFPRRRLGLEPRWGNVGFVVDKVALGQVFSEYFGFPCQFSFHRLLHTHYLSPGAGTILQLVADVTSGLGLTPLQEIKLTELSLTELLPFGMPDRYFRDKITCFIPSGAQ